MAERLATDADLVGFYSAFNTAALPTLRQLYLDMTATMVNVECLGEKASFAHLHLAAHYLSIHPDVNVSGSSPQVSVRSFGTMSISYAVPAALPDDGELSTTVYGRAFLSVMSGVFAPPVVGMPAGGVPSCGGSEW